MFSERSWLHEAASPIFFFSPWRERVLFGASSKTTISFSRNSEEDPFDTVSYAVYFPTGVFSESWVLTLESIWIYFWYVYWKVSLVVAKI